jgi:ABC-2 type transport system ATP-binding protein
VDLEGEANRRVGEFSLGMRQRLGLAAALLADPRLLVLDEPANGLDPAGTRWLRGFLRSLAASGRTVFVSSHQLAEVSQMADEVIVVDRGRLLTQRSVADLVSVSSGVSIRSPQTGRLTRALRDAGADVAAVGTNLLMANDITPERVGEIAAHEGIVLHELVPRAETLEDVFLRLTGAEGGR